MLCQTTDSVCALAQQQAVQFQRNAYSVLGQVLPDLDLKQDTFFTPVYSGGPVVIRQHIFYTAVHRDVDVESRQYISFTPHRGSLVHMQ